MLKQCFTYVYQFNYEKILKNKLAKKFVSRFSINYRVELGCIRASGLACDPLKAHLLVPRTVECYTWESYYLRNLNAVYQPTSLLRPSGEKHTRQTVK